LFVFLLIGRNDISGVVKNDKTCAGRTLINCANVF
jgi:hypothetical protein